MTQKTLRMRVFAGPNGSGKSTIINSIRDHRVNGIPVDFGIYINADEIAAQLRKGTFTFNLYDVKVTRNEFVSEALESGLIGEHFGEVAFKKSFRYSNNGLIMNGKKYDEEVAQIIADFLRKKLLKERKKFSFETVFSHPGKVEIMKKARAAGYKVYLYFVATESPEINVFRVKKVRVPLSGHDVPENKIRSRYYRSLELLFEASKHAYQAFFFDNSGDDFRMFAHFKLSAEGNKKWDNLPVTEYPIWFRKHYVQKSQPNE